jgi:hypothetical protein
LSLRTKWSKFIIMLSFYCHYLSHILNMVVEWFMKSNFYFCHYWSNVEVVLSCY